MSEIRKATLSSLPPDAARRPEKEVLLRDEIAGLQTIHYAIPAGHTVAIERVTRKGRVLLFTAGSGVLRSGPLTRTIREIAVFVPLRGQSLTVSAQTGMRCIELIVDFSEADMEDFAVCSKGLPYFLSYSDCATYSEKIKSPRTVSRTLLPEKTFPRLCVGSVETTGPDRVGEHRHPMLEQLFLGLDGNRGVVKADDAEMAFGPHELLHVPPGSNHSVRVDNGSKLHYIWIDLFKNREDVAWISEQHVVNPPTPQAAPEPDIGKRRMDLSLFGKKFTATTGILQLMEDLGRAMAGTQDVLMLGGGNPSHIPEVEDLFRKRLQEVLDDDDEFSHVVGDYDCPQGKMTFIESLASLLRKEFGWQIDSRNIAITLGSQTSFFALFNMFAGDFGGGRRKKILLPLAPEYIGYADIGLVDDFFATTRPKIEHLDNHLFKYHVDFDSVSVTDDIGAICVSRPTNPTGNVLSDGEIEKLDQLAKSHGIPLLIDNAYGTPFPNIIFTEAKPVWNENTIVCMSLSKLGLPGARTGIVIAREEVIKLISSFNAVMSLAPGSFGATIALHLVRSGDILHISRDIIRPYYQRRARQALAQLLEELGDMEFYIHKPEGALFLWIWLKDMPITGMDLYERLKKRGVLVVPGHYFFPGLNGNWRHTQECIRITYSQDESVVRRGLHIVAEEIKKAFRK